MTTRYTQDEWLAIIDQAEGDLPGVLAEYRAPTVGSAAFARTIDHTVLKFGTTQADVDRICAEAKKYNFKVGEPSNFKSSINFHAERIQAEAC